MIPSSKVQHQLSMALQLSLGMSSTDPTKHPSYHALHCDSRSELFPNYLTTVHALHKGLDSDNAALLDFTFHRRERYSTTIVLLLYVGGEPADTTLCGDVFTTSFAVMWWP